MDTWRYIAFLRIEIQRFVIIVKWLFVNIIYLKLFYLFPFYEELEVLVSLFSNIPRHIQSSKTIHREKVCIKVVLMSHESSCKIYNCNLYLFLCKFTITIFLITIPLVKNMSIDYHICWQPFSALSIILWSVKVAVTNMYRIDHMSQGTK